MIFSEKYEVINFVFVRKLFKIFQLKKKKTFRPYNLVDYFNPTTWKTTSCRNAICSTPEPCQPRVNQSMARQTFSDQIKFQVRRICEKKVVS